MNRKCTLLVSFLILSWSLVSIQNARAEDLAAGVKPGDWIKYRAVVNFMVSHPDQPPSESSVAGYVLVEVLSLIDYFVTSRFTLRLENGTVTSDVRNVSYRAIISPGYFIAANQSEGDLLDFGTLHLKINATLSQNCLGVEREVNLVELLSNSTAGLGAWVETSLIYQWDRASGVLIERSESHKSTSCEGQFVHIYEQIKIIDTNVWEINVIPYDLDRDGHVGISDIIICAEAFGSDSTTHSIRWNSYCDVDRDNRVGIKDLLTIALHFGESD